MTSAAEFTKPTPQLDETRWRRSLRRPRYLLCVDEPRQHATYSGKGSIHEGSTRATCELACLEWPVRRSDILRRFRIPHHFDNLKRWGSPARVNLREFYQLRFARIAPLLTVLLAILSGLHLAHIKGFVVAHKTGDLGQALCLPRLPSTSICLRLEEAIYQQVGTSCGRSPLKRYSTYSSRCVCRLFRRGRFLLIPAPCPLCAGSIARSRAFNPYPVWREYSYLGGLELSPWRPHGCFLLQGVVFRALFSGLLAPSAPSLLVFSLGFSIRTYIWGLGRNGLNMTILAVGACMVIRSSRPDTVAGPTLPSNHFSSSVSAAMRSI